MRIMHCTPEELQLDIIVEYFEEIVRRLRTELASDSISSTAVQNPLAGEIKDSKELENRPG